MNNILQIDELCEKSLMFIPARDLAEYDDDDDELEGGSIEIKLADLDKDQYDQFVIQLIHFSNNEGAFLISYIETYSNIQEITVEFKSNFKENLDTCVKQCWGK